MVLKHVGLSSMLSVLFYSSVILNGTETRKIQTTIKSLFYSSVILNGTETKVIKKC